MNDLLATVSRQQGKKAKAKNKKSKALPSSATAVAPADYF